MSNGIPTLKRALSFVAWHESVSVLQKGCLRCDDCDGAALRRLDGRRRMAAIAASAGTCLVLRWRPPFGGSAIRQRDAEDRVGSGAALRLGPQGTVNRGDRATRNDAQRPALAKVVESGRSLECTGGADLVQKLRISDGTTVGRELGDARLRQSSHKCNYSELSGGRLQAALFDHHTSGKPSPYFGSSCGRASLSQ